MPQRPTARRPRRPPWLPKPTPPPALPDKPWRPPALATLASGALRGLGYVLVEEIVEDLAGVRVARWPGAGADGLPVFADAEEEVALGVELGVLQRRVNRIRRPDPRVRGAARAELRRRPLALGDVFAAPVDAERMSAAGEADAPSEPLWLGEPLFDITVDAREMARQSFYLAVTAPLPESAVREIEEQQLSRTRGRR